MSDVENYANTITGDVTTITTLLNFLQECTPFQLQESAPTLDMLVPSSSDQAKYSWIKIIFRNGESTLTILVMNNKISICFYHCRFRQK